MSSNEIVLYQPEGEVAGVKVLVDDDTVWLTQAQMVELFQSSKTNVSEHISRVFAEGELAENSVVRNFRTTAADGKFYSVKHYNLDVIISVGYRVKSQRGTQFRIWATGILRNYMLKGYAISQRFEWVENQFGGIGQRVGKLEEQVSFFVRTALPPVEGVFYEGQIFDAYEFAAKLVKSARQRIALVDNYIDESVLLLLAKRRKDVDAIIYCGKVGRALLADLAKHNEQYLPIEIAQVTGIHDRFLIIDDEVYHLGASVKDLGKKLFAFNKMNIPATDILDKCKQK